MSLKRIHLLFFLLSVILVIVSYQQNPRFLSFHRSYAEFIHRPRLSEPVQYSNLKSTCQATAQYRHNPERTGVAPESAQPRAEVQILKRLSPFNVGIHSASKSTPTVDDSGVYVGSDTGWFWKLDHQGNRIWSFYIPTSGNGVHGSAAVDDKKVYIGAYDGFLYALNKENGELVWALPVADYIGASPLLADGHLYISAETAHPDGLVMKIDCNSGTIKWSSEWLGGHSHASPSFDKKSNQILVGANSGLFFALDNKTGKTNWKKQFKGPIKGTPMVWRDKVYFTSWDENLHALSIKDGNTLWSTYMGGRLQTSLTLVPKLGFGLTNTRRGDVAALDLTNGKFKWRLRHGDDNHQFSLAVTQDPKRPGEYLAWSRCKDFQLCVLDARKGKLQHNIDLPGQLSGAPFPWKDRIYMSLDQDQGFVILK